MRVSVRVPATNERGPLYMEQALAVIHQANPRRLPITLDIGRDGEELSLSLRFPPELRAVITSQLFAQYPDCRIQPVPDETVPSGHQVWWADLRLAPDLFPIRRFSQFEDALNRLTADPLTALLSAIPQRRDGAIQGRITITVRPCTRYRRNRAQKALRTLSRPFLKSHPRLAHLYVSLALSRVRMLRLFAWLLARLVPTGEGRLPPSPLTTSASRTHEREEDLQAASDKLSRHLFLASIRLVVTAPADASDTARRTLSELAGSFGLFSAPRLGVFRASRARTGRTLPYRPGPTFLLSTEELATLWHPSTVTVKAPALAQVESREFEPPTTLPTPSTHPDLAVLGVTAFRDRRERFGILPDDRLRHIAIQGKTGMGKSTLLFNLLASDIAAGRGVALIDPHGDLAEAILPAIPRSRTNDVVLFDAGDQSHPLAFNPLACRDPLRRPLVASGVVSVLQETLRRLAGGRASNTSCETPSWPCSKSPAARSSPCSGSSPMRGSARASSPGSHDPIVRAFWETEFAGMPPKLQAEAIAPIQNKVGQFVSSPLLRNILGQPHGRLDLRR